MPSLAEFQSRLRDAIVENRADAIAPFLVGGRDAAKRLAVHQRHYEASLANALLAKFPATTWLIGAPIVTEAARDFVRQHPPMAPCIADYGTKFPRYLADRTAARQLPYLCAFADLERHLGHAAIAVEHPAIGMEAFAAIEADRLPNLGLALQPSLHYCAADWPIDDLLKLFLSGSAPERYAFEPAGVHLEIRGARGEFRIDRLDPATFAFRKALVERQTIGAAAEQALERDAVFDPGRALTNLIVEDLVIAVHQTPSGAQP